jgi:hypothetical protein
MRFSLFTKRGAMQTIRVGRGNGTVSEWDGLLICVGINGKKKGECFEA